MSGVKIDPNHNLAAAYAQTRGKTVQELSLAERDFLAQVDGIGRSLIQVHLDPVGEDRAEFLLEQVRETLFDVRRAVGDFKAMRELMHRAIGELSASPGVTSEEGRQEELAFLRWLENDNFVFLGARVYEYPRSADGVYAAEEPLYEAEAGLGVLKDSTRAVLRRT